MRHSERVAGGLFCLEKPKTLRFLIFYDAPLHNRVLRFSGTDCWKQSHVVDAQTYARTNWRVCAQRGGGGGGGGFLL